MAVKNSRLLRMLQYHCGPLGTAVLIWHLPWPACALGGICPRALRTRQTVR